MPLSGIRLVGDIAEPKRPSTAVSGLGIDFSATDRAAHQSSQSFLYWTDAENFEFYDAVRPYTAPTWPASSQQTGPNATDTLPQSQSESPDSGVQFSTQLPRVLRRQSSHVWGQSTKALEVSDHLVTPFSGLLRRPHGSEDSQTTSGGLITPRDELDMRLVRLADQPEFGQMPRKAPEPPTSAPKTTRKPQLDCQTSVPHSMLRTLGSRKKETRVPPPLKLVSANAMGPARPGSAPVAQQQQMLSASKPTLSSAPSSDGVRMPLDDSSPRPNSRGSARRSSKNSTLSSLFRSVRRSISSSNSLRKSSKTSPVSLSGNSVPQNVPQLTISDTSCSGPRCSALFSHSKPRSPELATAEKPVANVRASSPTASKRPSTAPTSHQSLGTHSMRPNSARKDQRDCYGGSPAAHMSQPPQLEEKPAAIQLQYRNPWQSTFQAASTFIAPVAARPSEPTMSIRLKDVHLPQKEQNTSRSSSKSSSPADLYKQSVIKAEGLAVSLVKTCDFPPSPCSAAPSTLPSLTPMVGLPSPNASLLKPSSDYVSSVHARSPSSMSSSRLSTSSNRRGSRRSPKSKPAPPLPDERLFMMHAFGKAPLRDTSDPASNDSRSEAEARATPASVNLKKSLPSIPLLSTSHEDKGPAIQDHRDPTLARRPSYQVEIVTNSLPHYGKDVYIGCRPISSSSAEQGTRASSFSDPLAARSSLPDIRDSADLVPRRVEPPRRPSLAVSEMTIQEKEASYFSTHARQCDPYADTSRRPSYASGGSWQSVPVGPTRIDFRRPCFAEGGMRISFDTGSDA